MSKVPIEPHDRLSWNSRTVNGPYEHMFCASSYMIFKTSWLRFLAHIIAWHQRVTILPKRFEKHFQLIYFLIFIILSLFILFDFIWSFYFCPAQLFNFNAWESMVKFFVYIFFMNILIRVIHFNSEWDYIYVRAGLWWEVPHHFLYYKIIFNKQSYNRVPWPATVKCVNFAGICNMEWYFSHQDTTELRFHTFAARIVHLTWPGWR